MRVGSRTISPVGCLRVTLAALDPAGRQELAAALRSVAETLAEVRDGKTTSHVVGVLAICSTRPELSRVPKMTTFAPVLTGAS